MAFKFLVHKWQKITLVITLAILCLILILSVMINIYWSPILAKAVKNIVLKSSNSLYTVDFSSADLHVIQGSIVMFNITLKPDTAVYNRRKKLHLAPNNLIELHIKRLTLTHVHPFRLYFKHQLDIGDIVINQPELKISYQLNHTKDTVLKDNRTPWQKMSKSLHAVHIGEIELGDVKLRYEDYSGNKLQLSELKELNISAYDLLIDSTTQLDKSRLLYCKNIVAQLSNYAGKASSGLYTYKVKSVKLSTLNSQLTAEGIMIQPVNVNTFFEKSQSDRFTVLLDSIQLNNFDFLNYHKYRMLKAAKLTISQGTVAVFNSLKKSPGNGSDRVNTFPNAALARLGAELQIDSVLLHHINVVYSEYSEKSRKTGTIRFNNTSGYFSNITTSKEALKKNNLMKADLLTYFMARGKLNVAFMFDLTGQNNSFSYKGSLAAMNLGLLNTATVPLALVKITSGKLNRMDFDMKADRYRSSGRVALLYNNAKVILLKPDSVLNNLKLKPIASILANAIILKHNNPDVPGGIPRTFFVHYDRAPETPFFKFMWQTLLAGVKPSVGLNEKMQKEVVAMTTQQQINKQNRKIKKLLRQQRREERRKRRALKQSQKDEKAATAPAA